MNSIWRDVSRSQPCAICGKSDWCDASVDGAWAICRRIDTGDGQHRIDKSGIDFWLYRLDGSIPHQSSAVIEMPIVPHSPRADPSILHRVYGALLHELDLAPNHRHNLHSRGLSDSDISRLAYRTLPGQGRARLAKRLVERFGVEVCAHVPGVYLKEDGARRWWSLAGASGLLIPIRDQHGHITGLVVRADAPDANAKYSYLSSSRHGGPGPAVSCHVPLHDGTPVDTIRVTEGVLKADVSTMIGGLLTIGLPGVSGWRQAIPIINALQAKAVHVAFDADAALNLHVAKALQQTVRGLQQAGYMVKLDTWDGADGKGIDDLLAAGHQPALLEGTDMRQHLRETLHSAARCDSTPPRQPLVPRQAPVNEDHWEGRRTLPLRPYRGLRLGRMVRDA